jgi:hypothetical protein
VAIYSYVIVRDYGFAPNPFGDYCTLATCKPKIRDHASVGDWVIGTGSTQIGEKNNLVFAMLINEILTFDEYWHDKRFEYKKPQFNGSLKQMYGDNVYHFSKESKEYIQENSHHSKPDGVRNERNYKRDLKSKKVLISENFWYFGNDSIEIPKDLCDEICKSGRGRKKIEDKKIIKKYEDWLNREKPPGYYGHPHKFEEAEFQRYEGE